MKMYRLKNRSKTLINLDHILTVHGWETFNRIIMEIQFKDRKEGDRFEYDSIQLLNDDLDNLSLEKDK